MPFLFLILLHLIQVFILKLKSMIITYFHSLYYITLHYFFKIYSKQIRIKVDDNLKINTINEFFYF